MTPAERITAHMIELGLGDQDVADEVGVTARTVRYWRTGKSRPRDHHAIRLARVLDIPLEDLAGE